MTRTRHRMDVSLPTDRAIKLSREFSAPARLVFEAYSQPEHVLRWWGLRNAEMTVCDIDFREGGRWRYVTTEADGSEVAFNGTYREIVPYERIVHTETFEMFPDNPSLVTVSFEERDGRTTVTLFCEYDSPETRDMVVASGMEHGAAESYDRLEELLESLPESSPAPGVQHTSMPATEPSSMESQTMSKMTVERAGDTELVIRRTFAAPRDLVWKAWTEPDRIVRWWGPNGFTTEVREMDVRPGGTWHYCMRSPEWGDAWGKAIYDEVVAPERLVYRDAFSDEAGAWIPPESHVTTTFTAQDGQTLMHTRSSFASKEDLEQVVAMGMEEGMSQTLDRLEAYVSGDA